MVFAPSSRFSGRSSDHDRFRQRNSSDEPTDVRDIGNARIATATQHAQTTDHLEHKPKADGNERWHLGHDVKQQHADPSLGMQHQVGAHAAGQALLTCGAFTPEGEFLEVPELDMDRLESAWRVAVFALYLAEGKIEPEVVKNMRTCRAGQQLLI